MGVIEDKDHLLCGPGAAEGAFEATGDAPVSLPRAPGHRPCFSGFGDLATEGLERDVRRFGPRRIPVFNASIASSSSAVSSKSNTAKCSPILSGRTDFGIAERPCCRCQRSITCAGDLPCATPIAVIVGSWRAFAPPSR